MTPTTVEERHDTGSKAFLNYSEEIKRLIQDEQERLYRILHRIDDSMDAIHETKKLLNSF